MKRAITVKLDAAEIKLKPIRFQKQPLSTYTMEATKLISSAEDARFISTLKQGDESISMYKKTEENTGLQQNI